MKKEFLPWLRGRKHGPNAGVLVPDEPAPGGALAASPSAEPTATDAGNATPLGGLEPASLAGTTRKLLVVLVEFANWSFTYPDDSTWRNLFLGSTASAVNGYYLEVSPHSFHFAPAAESYGIAAGAFAVDRVSGGRGTCGTYPNCRVVGDDFTAAGLTMTSGARCYFRIYSYTLHPTTGEPALSPRHASTSGIAG